MPSSFIFSLDKSKYSNIDARLKPFLDDWYLEENYKGEIVKFPDTGAKSDIFPTKYFHVIKEPHEHNYKPNGEEDEIGLVMEAGWPGYDSEVIINLFVIGPHVTNGTNKVSAEILKVGGADMTLSWNDKPLPSFTQEVYKKKSGGFFPAYEKVIIERSKIWVDDMNSL